MQIEVPAAGPQVDLSNSLYAVFLAAEHVGRNGNVLERLPNGGGRRPRSALCVDVKEECLAESAAFESHWVSGR